MIKKFHFIEHAPYEGLGVIRNWISKRQGIISCTKPYLGETLPSSQDFEMLIVMGGPQSPLELEKFPFLASEIEFTAKALVLGKKIFGVCLGAQIISEALGYRTQQSPNPEYGVYPILLTQAREHIFFEKFPDTFNALHWHNDMPAIPADALSIGPSIGCPNQGFLFDENTAGFQFHLELDNESLISMLEVDHSLEEKVGKFISTKSKLIKTDLSTMNNLLFSFLDRFVGG